MALGNNLIKNSKSENTPKNEEKLSQKEVPVSPVPPPTPVIENAVTAERKTFNFSDDNIKIIYEPSRRTKVSLTKTFLEGHLTISNMENIKLYVSQAFDHYNQVDILLRNVAEIDITCLQFLYFTKMYSEPQKKLLTIDSEIKPDLKKIITNAGFKDFLFKVKNID